MSIFKRGGQSVAQQTSTSAQPSAQAGDAKQTAKLTPPIASAGQAARNPAAPGVVPPPAAPIYSMRLPEPAPRLDARAASASEKVMTAGEVRVSVQRTRTAATSVNGVARRPAQHTGPALQPQDRQAFDPVRAAQTGLLHLAWSWQQAGSPIRAIHAYMELLCRYPDTPAADAAVSDLEELSNKLVDEGQFHTALAIYDQLEELLT